MKQLTRKLPVLVILVLLALTLASSATPTAECFDKFCLSCEQTCSNDYQQVILDCMNDGNPLLVCQIRNKDWMHNCGVVMCPVCGWYENY
jgi:hypothetical protein